ncbi:MAG: rhomboid family intramembrane serine protease [Flavobacteriales bacterium]
MNISSEDELNKKSEKISRFYAIFFPVVFILTIWLTFIIDHLFGLDLQQYGIYPRHIKGLKGVVFSPFLHGSWNHLINNTTPSLVLGAALFYFYRKISFRVLILIWLISGVCIWISARGSYHIGASSVIYGLASFLFFSGIFRNNVRLLAITLIITFLYGSMVWGVFPIKPGISWEGHLWGALTGLVLAYYYRNEGPKRKLYQWEIDEMREEEARKNRDKLRIKYHYKEKDDNGSKEE